MKRYFMILSFLVISTMLFGCVKRTITDIESHPDKPLMHIETSKYSSFLGVGKAVHEFWDCQLSGDTLVCEKACDGNTGLECPSATQVGSVHVTNIR